MLFSLDQVALYLNRAVLVIKGAGGSLKFLTGAEGATIPVVGARAEETQCLSFGNALWIANNDDNDTHTQMALLARLGIGTREALMDHVDEYQGSVMPMWRGAINIAEGTPAEVKLLHKLASRNDEDRAEGEKFSPPAANLILPRNPAVNLSYKLGTGASPPTSGIVFVTGSYSGNGGDALHAEQKLLAAMSQVAPNVTGAVTISGCKMACSTCEGVLDAVAERVSARGIALRYNNSAVNALRDEVGLRKKNSHGIRALDTAAYFPAEVW
jgi:hypothetical protein